MLVLSIPMQGRRKEILTYTATAKWLKPYRLVQKFNDCKRENIVCRAHMHTRHANTGGLGHDAPENFDLYYCIFMVLTSKIDLLPQKLYILAPSVI